MTQQRKEILACLIGLVVLLALMIIFGNVIAEVIFWAMIAAIGVITLIYVGAFITEKNPNEIVEKIPLLNNLLDDVELIPAMAKECPKKPDVKESAKEQSEACGTVEQPEKECEEESVSAEQPEEADNAEQPEEVVEETTETTTSVE